MPKNPIKHSSSFALKKSLGAFYTPRALAEYIANWAVRGRSDRVLEPSAGDGVFLEAAISSLVGYGASKHEVWQCLQGFEISKASSKEAVERASGLGFDLDIRNKDFLSISPSPKYDAVIGNPPYVRYRNVDERQKKAIAAISRESHVDISPQSSIWMPFVIHSTSFLREGGRIGFVLPAEFLSVNYAAPLRAFMLESFSCVELITFEEAVFPEIQEEVVVLLASGWGKGRSSSISWKQCRGLDSLKDVVAKNYRPRSSFEKWTSLFASRDAEKAMEDLHECGHFAKLGDWGKVSLGIVTGNNGYFALSEDDMDRHGLSSEDVLPLSQPGSRHLRRLDFSIDDWAELREKGSKSYLFFPGNEPTPAAKRYIDHGRDCEIDKTYKCRKRGVWWRVPLGEKPDAFFTCMNSYGPNICYNSAGVYVLNSCHGIYFNDDIGMELQRMFPIACLNSMTMFDAEIVGRAYGGGMLKLEPREAANLLVPSKDLLMSCIQELSMIKHYVEDALEKRDFESAIALVDSVILPNLGINEEAYSKIRSSGAIMRMRRKNRLKGFKVVS